MTGFDYNGTAAIVAAVFAGIAWVIGALNHRASRQIRAQVDTGPESASLGQIVAGLAQPPPTPPGPPNPPAP